MSELNISVNAREGIGRGANRRLRGSGMIPGVIYSKGESRAVSFDNKAFAKLWHDLIGRTPLVTLNEGKKEFKALIQEVQRDPIKDTFIHVDFFEVTAGEEITAKAALHTLGEAFGVRNEGGTMEIHLHEIEVRSRPSNIPDFIEVDVTDMEVGDALHASDLPKLEGVTYQLHEDTLVVSIAGATKEELEPEVVVVDEELEGEESDEEESEAPSEEEEKA